MIVEGESASNVAERLGIPRSTLRDAVARFQADPATLKAISDQTLGIHAAIAHRAAGKLYDDVDSLPYDLLIRAYGVASDKLAAHLGVGRDRDAAAAAPESAAHALSLLADALQGRELTLSVRALASDAAGQGRDEPDRADQSGGTAGRGNAAQGNAGQGSASPAPLLPAHGGPAAAALELEPADAEGPLEPGPPHPTD